MKPYKEFILLRNTAAITLVVSAILVSCLRLGPAKNDRRRNDAVAADLTDYTNGSHLQRCRYQHYADRASAEGNRTAAGLFSALARSEHIHEDACTRVSSLVGGECRPNISAAFAIASTDENLRLSIEDERLRLTERRGEPATRAIESGNHYIARILIWVDGTNRRHIELLERCLSAAEGCGACEYEVCPVCGNVYESECCDDYCPLCRTHRSQFEYFGRLQIDKAVADGVDH